MKPLLILFLTVFLCSCEQAKYKQPVSIVKNDAVQTISYDRMKESIAAKRKQFAANYTSLNPSDQTVLRDYWVNAISNDLFSQWENTPWDFNGTTTRPKEGSIACGYFVASLLQDMDLHISRVKLSVCAASEMMKSLVPGQRIKNLNALSYPEFNDKLKEYGKGVYIIGLDFHTGFIVNDGTETWFIHSNYIGRKGVTKETVLNSFALKSSGTKWLVSLTGDKNFLIRWLKG